MPALTSHSNNLSGLEPWQERFGHGAASNRSMLRRSGDDFDLLGLHHSLDSCIWGSLFLSLDLFHNIIV